MPGKALAGKVTWVVGGVGLIGKGICRGLLRAGSTVIVNSRSAERLSVLNDELAHPENLICLEASMMPKDSARTVEMAMERTNNQLDHIVAHSSVRWWDPSTGDDGSLVNELVSCTGRLLDVSPEDFAAASGYSASMHFAAAHHLIPKLGKDGSYTFLTGGPRAYVKHSDTKYHRASARGPLAQINAYGVWGLASSLRHCEELKGSDVRVHELRVGEIPRQLRPESAPFSDDIGVVVAGMCANEHKEEPTHGIEHVSTTEDLEALKGRFPVKLSDYGILFQPESW